MSSIIGGAGLSSFLIGTGAFVGGVALAGVTAVGIVENQQAAGQEVPDGAGSGSSQVVNYGGN